MLLYPKYTVFTFLIKHITWKLEIKYSLSLKVHFNPRSWINWPIFAEKYLKMNKETGLCCEQLNSLKIWLFLHLQLVSMEILTKGSQIWDSNILLNPFFDDLLRKKTVLIWFCWLKYCPKSYVVYIQCCLAWPHLFVHLWQNLFISGLHKVK